MGNEKEFYKWMTDSGMVAAAQYKYKINDISSHYSEEVDENINLYNISDISYISNIVKMYDTKGKYKEFGQYGKSGNDNGHCRAAIKKYLEFLKFKQSGNPESTVKVSIASNVKSVQKNTPEINNDFLSSYYNWIAGKTKDLFIQINEYRRECKKEVIFKETDSLKLWDGVGKLCNSQETFEVFSKSLHGLFLENARDEVNTGNYRSRFPDSFYKNETWTKEFIYDVKIIRNKYAHPKSKDNIQENNEWRINRTFLNVCEKYLGNRDIPQTTDNFQELQIGIMSQFKNVLRKLFDIVKKG